MGVVTARLLFLAFLALTATITYNALYLQAHPPHGMADATLTTPVGYATTRVIGVEPSGVDASTSTRVASAYEKTPVSGAVATDLPAQMPSGGESQLVVRAIQRELSLLGYDVGGVDGQLSDKTRQAISAFQMREGLAVTGLPSDDVLRQILLGDAISTSDVTGSIPAADSIAAHVGENGTVLRVQQVLAELGYTPGTIDGDWGQNTADAVSAFQRDRNMAVTGTINPELLSEFQRVTGRDFARTAARR